MPEGTLQRTGPRCSPPATGCARHCAPRAPPAPYIDPAAAPPLARPRSESLPGSDAAPALSQAQGEGWGCSESQSKNRTGKEAGRRAEGAEQAGGAAPLGAAAACGNPGGDWPGRGAG